MPMMMEDEMDMDDLFGDGAGLSLPNRPPPTKELYQRLDELRANGCSQGISWSRWGSIATIASNGVSLELRNLRCHPRDGSWGLSEPTVTPNFASPEGGPLKHLSWSPTGQELAVIDASGRVTILTVLSSLNKPSLGRNCQTDTVDDLHSVVGCFWLNVAPPPGPAPNIKRPLLLYGPATKDRGDYRYETQSSPVLPPHHPNHARSAFIYLTTNGVLRLLWQQNGNGKWQESQNELESIASSDDLITHAAICPDKNETLLIAFATTSKQLHTVRAVIDWGQQRVDKAPLAAIPINPSIRAKHIAVTSWLQSSSNNTLNASHTEPSMAQLSHLEFLPPTLESANRMSLPTILAVRSHMPGSTTHYNQEVYTTVDRWEVREKPQNLHPAFEQLSSRRNSIGSTPGPVCYLKHLEAFTVNKIMIHMESLHLSKIVFFAYSDGSIEYRERSTMAETYNDGNLDRIMHLSQIGFTYADNEPCLQVALSPTTFSMVKLRNDGKLNWCGLDYNLGSIGASTEDARYAAFISTLAIAGATAVVESTNFDDLLAIANKHAAPQFTYDWGSEMSSLLKVQADYSEESHHNALVRNTHIQFCLCLQTSLGFKGEFNPRTFSGKFAWLVLQLRNIVVLTTMAANMTLPTGNGPERISPLDDPEVINTLAGSIRYMLDLLAWLTDTLLTMPTVVPSNINLTDVNELSLPDLLAHLHATKNVSLHMLLSSSSRGFLLAICRRFQYIDYTARKAIVLQTSTDNTPGSTNHNPRIVSPALHAAYHKIATITSNAIVRIKTMETLITAVSTLVKTAYTSNYPPLAGSQAAEFARRALEIKMLFGSSFPEAFKPVIVELFKKDGLLETVRSELDPAKLFFADFSLLEVDEDAASVAKRKNAHLTMDSFKKGWMVNPVSPTTGQQDGARREDHTSMLQGGLMGTNGAQGARWRRCARCAAVMEDVLTAKQTLQWLVAQQRRCFCSGYFDTISPGHTFA